MPHVDRRTIRDASISAADDWGRSQFLAPLPEQADNAAMQTEPPEADPPKRKRRWFQFSLRSLLIGVTLFCAAVWLATIGVSYGTAEVVAWTIIACVPLLFVVRSAYRDACRRQRWPGKSREAL